LAGNVVEPLPAARHQSLRVLLQPAQDRIGRTTLVRDDPSEPRHIVCVENEWHENEAHYRHAEQELTNHHARPALSLE